MVKQKKKGKKATHYADDLHGTTPCNKRVTNKLKWSNNWNRVNCKMCRKHMERISPARIIY